MRKYVFLLFYSCLLGAALLTGSCADKIEEEKIDLPPTPVLSIRSNWGVVKSSVLRIREEPFLKARILAHLRKGSVLEILSRGRQKENLENESSYWYQVNYAGLRGWVFGAYLEILDSRVQAKSFAAELK